MNQEQFEELLTARIKAIRAILSSKNKEYATDEDKLHNFKRAGKMLQCSPEQALIGMLTKHIISILDIVDKIEYNNEYPRRKLLEEKATDAINYLILLEALIVENKYVHMREKMR